MKKTYLLALIAITSNSSAFAAEFIGASGSDYNTGSNWDTGGVPGSGNGTDAGSGLEDARIDGSTDFAVLSSGSTPIADDVVVLRGGRLDITGGTLNFDNRLLLRDASTVNHSGGTFTGPSFLLGSNDNTPGSNYNLSGSGVVTATTLVVGNNVGSASTFTITGNAASVTASTKYTARNGGTQKFVSSATGFTTINTGNIDLINADNITLTVDLSALVITSDVTFTLINSTSGLTALETFTTATIIGVASNPTVNAASIRYDTVNSDVLLDVTFIPEPSTTLLLLSGLGALTLRRRR